MFQVEARVLEGLRGLDDRLAEVLNLLLGRDLLGSVTELLRQLAVAHTVTCV
jgi:hypothetical protein